jgi:hypothetical protein
VILELDADCPKDGIMVITANEGFALQDLFGEYLSIVENGN